MADLSAFARIRAKKRRQMRRRIDNSVGLYMESLERRQLLAVLGDLLVEGNSEVAGAAYSDSAEPMSASDSSLGTVHETTSFQEEVPAGLEGTAVQDTANYFDALREYYDEASETIGVDDDADWSAVALSLEDQTTDIETPIAVDRERRRLTGYRR